LHRGRDVRDQGEQGYRVDGGLREAVTKVLDEGGEKAMESGPMFA